MTNPLDLPALRALCEAATRWSDEPLAEGAVPPHEPWYTVDLVTGLVAGVTALLAEVERLREALGGPA